MPGVYGSVYRVGPLWINWRAFRVEEPELERLLTTELSEPLMTEDGDHIIWT
jgi:hypothetical protein